MKINICVLANAIQAYNNCVKSHNAYLSVWAERIQECENLLPHGSGLDSGCKIDLKASNENRIVINTSFHHLNEVGFYDGWTEHKIILTPSLIHGYQISITGRNRNEIKEYLTDVFSECFCYDLTGKEIIATETV